MTKKYLLYLLLSAAALGALFVIYNWFAVPAVQPELTQEAEIEQAQQEAAATMEASETDEQAVEATIQNIDQGFAEFDETDFAQAELSDQTLGL